jgi:hypothetical protein
VRRLSSVSSVSSGLRDWRKRLLLLFLLVVVLILELRLELG